MTMTSSDLMDRMMELHPNEIDLTLGRIERLLAQLGNPERKLPPVIHIAGTNGKGSVQAMLRAGLEAAGGRVHAYTSPHIVNFHERIRVAGRQIDEENLVAVLDETLRVNGDASITFFESTTAAAFVAFEKVKADWTLLEVGLGGRLDATNVIDKPALTIITPIARDHQEFLGSTLSDIATEKAGILKTGVPCVVARQDPEVRETVEARAELVAAPLLIEGQDWQAYRERDRLIVEDQKGLVDLPLPKLVGAHQIANAGLAVVALRALGFGETAASGAVTDANWPGRLQSVDLPGIVGTKLILDVGHNVHAARSVLKHLKDIAPPNVQTILCVGMLKSRDVSEVLNVFDGFFECGVPLDLSEFGRGHSGEVVKSAMKKAGLQTLDPQTILGGIEHHRKLDPDRPALVLAFGSFHVAEILSREVPIPGLELA